MTDGAGGQRLILEILRAIAEEYGWPGDRMETHTLAKVNPKTLRMYPGVYLFSGLFKMVVTLDNGQLYLQYGPFGDKPRKLFPETKTRFFMASAPFIIEFQREADGSVKKAKGRNGAEELDGEKIVHANP